MPIYSTWHSIFPHLIVLQLLTTVKCIAARTCPTYLNCNKPQWKIVCDNKGTKGQRPVYLIWTKEKATLSFSRLIKSLLLEIRLQYGGRPTMVDYSHQWLLWGRSVSNLLPLFSSFFQSSAASWRKMSAVTPQGTIRNYWWSSYR